MAKQISNPYSTSGAGIHFENRVQSAFALLMLTGGLVPCLPPWPISGIKLQGKYQGYNTDDIIVFCDEPTGRNKTKLLGQIKHTISFTEKDEILQDVIDAAWEDFNNNAMFSEESKDALVLITGPLSGVDTDSVRPLLEQARSSADVKDFIVRTEQAIFTSNKQREKLEVFQKKLKIANKGVDLSNDQLWRFLKSFYLLIYDLDIKGVIYSLLHTLIEQYSRKNSQAIWAQINEHVQWVSSSAGLITIDNIPDEIKKCFEKLYVEIIPDNFVNDTSTPQVSDWNLYEGASDLTIALIVGEWNENNPNDRVLLSMFARKDYFDWINNLRQILHYSEPPVEFNNGVWRVKDRKKLWQSLASRIFDEHLETLKSCSILLLSERDPKFELAKEDRYAAQVHGKILKYSKTIRKGITEALALVGSDTDLLKNCSMNMREAVVILAIREILNNSDWVLWGSLNDLLPTIAEAAPDEFLKTVENILNTKVEIFLKLFAQEGDGITGWNFLTGLLWALEGLAWEETYIVRVTIVLGALSSIDPGGNWANRPANSLAHIFLPWLPQTKSSFEKRRVAIQTLYKTYPEVAWKLLLGLLPRPGQISTGTYKPQYRKYDKIEAKVSTEEYNRQIEYYSELVVEKGKDNIIKLTELIVHLDNLPKPAFDKLLEYLSNDSMKEVSDELKNLLWTSLLDFSTKHRKFKNAKWALPSEIISIVEEVAKNIAPKSFIFRGARLFNITEYDLYNENEDWDKTRKIVNDQREEATREIFISGGLESIFIFLGHVKYQFDVGSSLAKISDPTLDIELFPKYLHTKDEKIRQFLSGYILGRYYNNKDYIHELNTQGWTEEEVASMLCYLPFESNVWEFAVKVLKEESLYWKYVPVNPYTVDDKLGFAIDKLIEYDRPFSAINCIYKEVFQNKPLDINRAVKALMKGGDTMEKLKSMDDYHITEIIKTLQKDSSVNRQDLIDIEWIYLEFFYEGTGVSPITLENALSSDYQFFFEVIKILYRSKYTVEGKDKIESSEAEKNKATRVWELLNRWQIVPGFQMDGCFNGTHFKEWLNKVMEKCTESGHLEVALHHIGKVLFYTPEDESGFWINKTVAETLNGKDVEDLRNGFSNEVYNSQGFGWMDPTGAPELNLSEEYKKKAEVTENEGYYLFASKLREVSEYYKRDARAIVDNHRSDIQEITRE